MKRPPSPEANPIDFNESCNNNLAGISLTPKQIANEVSKYFPDFEISYKPDFRQEIADSWPQSIDDSYARNDWSWKPKYDLKKMSFEMIENLKKLYTITV